MNISGVMQDGNSLRKLILGILRSVKSENRKRRSRPFDRLICPPCL